MIFRITLFATLLIFNAQASGTFDYPVFKTVTLTNFPHVSVPVYKSHGKRGPAVLLVHGNSASSRSYVKQVFSHLGRTHKLFLLDLPGNGLATKVDPSSTLPPTGFPEYQFGLLEAVAVVANDPDVAAEVFVGWSLGGDVLLLAQGSGIIPTAKGIFIFGTAPAGANPPTQTPPFKAPFVPGVPGLAVLASFGFSFQPNPAPPGFDFNGKFTNAVPPYATTPISSASNIGNAYVSAFFKNSRRLSGNYPLFFTQDGFERSDDRFRSSIGVFSFGLLPPATPPVPDELVVLQNLNIPIAVVVGKQDAFINIQYLEDLKENNYIPTLWRNKIIKVRGAGHAVQYERAGRFNLLLRKFINDVS